MANKWWTLVAVCVGTFMLLLDITVVMVVLPSLQGELGATLSDLQWVVDAYALSLAALLLTAGSLADRFGRRRLYVIGVAVFALASAVCGLAGSPEFLVVARAAQGVGGALMFATALALLGHVYRGRDRSVAFAVWGALTGIAVGLGPLVGGALTASLSWRWIFFVNIPIAAAAIVIAQRRTPESRDPEAGRVDWGGLVTFSGALAALIFGLIRGNPDGWGSPGVLGCLIAAPVLLAVFVVFERRGSAPMFDLSLFRKPAFAGVSTAAFALSASIIALQLFLVLYLQNVLGYSALETGLRLLALSGAMFVFGALSGRLSEHVPARTRLGVGLALVGSGILLMRGLSADSDWTALLAGLIAAGAGGGLMNPALASAAVDVVPPNRAGMGSGINNTFRQVGIATGIAGLGAVFQHHVTAALATGLAHVPGLAPQSRGAIAEGIAAGHGGHAASALPPNTRDAVAEVARAAFSGGLNEIFLIAGCVALAASALVLGLVRTGDLASSSEPARVGRGRSRTVPA
jgi:EmrB/QacA subfamily drug resistance transporter